MNYRQQLREFDIDTLPDLDVAVMGALELFADTKLPTIDTRRFERPLVVGSGNAATAGRIIFADKDAVFATESMYQEKLDSISAIDGVVIISASGSKHAVTIAAGARAAGLPVTLITNTSDSPAETELDHDNSQVLVFPKNREPYTYNTSTYLGMILAKTGEDPRQINEFINQELADIDYSQFADTDKFFIIVPSQFEEIVPMLEVKFIELFGRKIARDVKTSEYMLHAATVVPSEELFVSFGHKNTTWGLLNNRLHVPLPDNASYGAMMAIGYWVVGQVQKHQPDYFKQNIESYTQKISGVLGKDIQTIVPGSDV